MMWAGHSEKQSGPLLWREHNWSELKSGLGPVSSSPAQSVLCEKTLILQILGWAADQSLSHPDPRKHNQCENTPGMIQIQIKQGLAISWCDLCCDLDNIREKSTKKRAVAKKVVDVRVWKWVRVTARSSRVISASSVCREAGHGHIGDGKKRGSSKYLRWG